VAEFPTTRISLVRAAGAKSPEALGELCRIYWNPLYSYVRRHGYDADSARDLTQSFIARLIEKNSLEKFRSERGRFRSFLLGSLRNFLTNEHDAAHALKRGGGATLIPVDSGIRHDETPERAFERQWALNVLARVFDHLRKESASAGNNEQFEKLRAHLTGEDDATPYKDLGAQLSMTETAVKTAIYRLRKRFHEALRREISKTVADPSDIGDEIRHLVAALRP